MGEHAEMTTGPARDAHVEIPVTFTRVSDYGQLRRYKVRVGQARAAEPALDGDDIPDTTSALDAAVLATVEAEAKLEMLQDWATEFSRRHLSTLHPLLQAIGHQARDRVWLRFLLEEAELAGLPLELLVHPAAETCKLVFQDHPRIDIVRSIARDTTRRLPAWPAPSIRKRLLFVWAAPRGTVPYKEQRELLEPYAAACDIVELRYATRDDLRTALHEKGPFHFIHVLAHGGHLETGGVGLCLHAPGQSGVDVLAPGMLTDILDATLARPVMITLAVCQGAGADRRRFGALAHQLHLRGVPLVIGSQAKLSFSAAQVFTRCVLGGVLSGQNPLHALEAFRRELAGDPEYAWASMAAYCAYRQEELEDAGFLSPGHAPKKPAVWRPVDLLEALSQLPRQRQRSQRCLLELIDQVLEATGGHPPPDLCAPLDPHLLEQFPLRGWEDAADLATWGPAERSLTWLIQRRLEVSPDEALAPGIALLLRADPAAAARCMDRLDPARAPGLVRLRPFLASAWLEDHRELTALLEPALEGGVWADRFVHDGGLWRLASRALLPGIEGLFPASRALLPGLEGLLPASRALLPGIESLVPAAGSDATPATPDRAASPSVWIQLPTTPSSSSSVREDGYLNIRWPGQGGAGAMLVQARFCLRHVRDSGQITCQLGPMRSSHGD